MRRGIALVGGLAEPRHRLGLALRHALARLVHRAEAELRHGHALGGGQPVVFERIAEVGAAVEEARAIDLADMALRQRVALVRGLHVPIERLAEIRRDGLAAFVETADVLLRRGIALVRQRLQQLPRLFPVALLVGGDAVFERPGPCFRNKRRRRQPNAQRTCNESSAQHADIPPLRRCMLELLFGRGYSTAPASASVGRRPLGVSWSIALGSCWLSPASRSSRDNPVRCIRKEICSSVST